VCLIDRLADVRAPVQKCGTAFRREHGDLAAGIERFKGI
jgi:hypothetical protein